MADSKITEFAELVAPANDDLFCIVDDPSVSAETKKITYSNSGIPNNTAHRQGDGSDHGYIDQDVTSGSSPVFNSENMTGIPPIQYDAVVDITGGGDYTSLYTAFNSGAITVYIKKGFYVETNTIVIPEGGQLDAENGAIVSLAGSVRIECDGSGGSQYTDGTISTTTNSTTVTGSGTLWLVNATVGQFIKIGSEFFIIASVTNDTELELTRAWRGDALSGKAYFIQTMYTGCTIRNLIITGSSVQGIYIRGLVGVTLDNVNCSSNTGNNIEIISSYGVDLQHVISKGSTAHGIVLNDVYEASLENNCHADSNNASGVVLSGDTKDTNILSCSGTSNGGNGLLISNTASKISIISCIYEYCDTNGIRIDSGASEITISTCVIEDNGVDGIEIAGDNCTLLGNRIIDNAVYGVHIETTSDGNNLNYNAVEGNAIKQTYDEGTGTVSQQAPRLTTTERDDIVNPIALGLITNTTLGKLQYYNGVSWANIEITEIDPNTTHRSSDGKDHSDVVTLNGFVDQNVKSGSAPVLSGTNFTNVSATSLGGQNGAYYLARANHTGTQTASTISDFDTEVSNNTNVSANTTAIANLSQTDLAQEINAQTGSTYTLLESDHGKLVTLDSGSAIALTVPSGLRSDFQCVIMQRGAGQVTISGSGATVNNADSFDTTEKQYVMVNIIHLGSNVYVTDGRLIP